MHMDLVPRIQGILLKPKEEWIKIKEEALPVSKLFTTYAMILAAIPAAAQFIGFGLVGYRVPFVGWFRFGLGTSLLRSVFYYALALVSVYVLGLVINALAPTFASKQNQENAMKIAVFSMTPAWVVGVLYIVPFLGILAVLAALYGIYILYLGFATGLMETPKEKAVSYFVAVVVVSIVLWIVTAVVLGAVFAVGGVFRTI